MLDFYSHGKSEELVFGTEKYTGKQLVTLADNLSDVSYTIDTTGCYGGGLVDGILEDDQYRNDAHLQSRLAVFTHTKGNVPNLSAAGGRIGGEFTDQHMIEFIDALLKGQTYGSAALHADDTMKATWFTDAESIIDGKKLTQATTMQPTQDFLLSYLDNELESFS